MFTATAPDIATPALDCCWLPPPPEPEPEPLSCVSVEVELLSSFRMSDSDSSSSGSGAALSLPGVAPPWLAGALVPSTSVPPPAVPPAPPAPVPSPAPATGLDTREPETARLPTKPLFSLPMSSLPAENEPAAPVTGVASSRRWPIRAWVSRLTSLMATLMPTPTVWEPAAAPATVPTQVASRAWIDAVPVAATVAPRATWATVVALVTLTSTTPFTATVLACPPDAPSVTDTSSLPASTFKSFE